MYILHLFHTKPHHTTLLHTTVYTALPPFPPPQCHHNTSPSGEEAIPYFHGLIFMYHQCHFSPPPPLRLQAKGNVPALPIHQATDGTGREEDIFPEASRAWGCLCAPRVCEWVHYDTEEKL